MPNRQVDLITEKYDISIRIKTLPLVDSNLIVRNLSISKQFVIASPKLLNRNFVIEKPEELNKFPILMMKSLSSEYQWNLINSNNDFHLLKCKPRFITTDLKTLYSATLHGVGGSKLPESMIRNDLKSGNLFKVIPEWEPK